MVLSGYATVVTMAFCVALRGADLTCLNNVIIPVLYHEGVAMMKAAFFYFDGGRVLEHQCVGTSACVQLNVSRYACVIAVLPTHRFRGAVSRIRYFTSYPFLRDTAVAAKYFFAVGECVRMSVNAVSGYISSGDL